MMNLETAKTIEAPAGGWKPDTFAGTSRGDLSKQWLARPADQRFVSLSDLHGFTKDRFEAMEELRIDNKELRVIAPETKSRDDLHKLSVALPTGVEVAPTNWAFGQMATLAKAPAGYLKTLPSPIVADALNYGLRYNRSQEMVKTFSGEYELNAINGPDYGRIPDFEVAAAVMNVAGNGTGDSKWKVPGVLDWRTGIYDPRVPVTKDTTTLFASDRDLFIFLVDDLHPIVVGKTAKGEDDLMFRGFYVKNSEVGRTSLEIAAFYLRAICCNRIMWGVEGFEEISIRHSKYAPDRFVEVARPALESFATGSSAKLIDGVEKAKAAKLAANDEDMVEFLKAREFTKTRITDIMEAVEREEGHPARTAWDVAQGITAVARNVPNQDDRVDLELAAGAILDKVAA